MGLFHARSHCCAVSQEGTYLGILAKRRIWQNAMQGRTARPAHTHPLPRSTSAGVQMQAANGWVPSDVIGVLRTRYNYRRRLLVAQPPSPNEAKPPSRNSQMASSLSAPCRREQPWFDLLHFSHLRMSPGFGGCSAQLRAGDARSTWGANARQGCEACDRRCSPVLVALARCD